MLGKYAFLLGLIMPFFVSAQETGPFSIRGSVSACSTGLPLSGANIVLQKEQKHATTDDEGMFFLPKMAKGSYRISVSSIGFETAVKTVALHTDTSVCFCLKPQELVLDDVAVYAHHLSHTTVRVDRLDKDALKESKGAVLGELLKIIPGMNRLQTGSTIVKPVIHGMHGNRILLINNGVKQEGQQWGAEHAPEIDPFIATSIQVIKGADAVQYGADAIGGVIIVEPDPLPLESKFGGSFTLVGSSNGRAGIGSAMLEGTVQPIPGLSWRTQGSFKKAGSVRTADYYLMNTGARELNYSAAFSYRHRFGTIDAYYSHFDTDLGIFSGAHIGSLEDLKTRIQNGRPFIEGKFDYNIDAPRQKVVHDLIKIKGHKLLNNGNQFTFQYDFQRNSRQEYDIRRGGRSDVPAVDLQLDAHTVRITYQQLRQKRFHARLGIDANSIVNNSIPGTFSTPLIPNYDRYQVGLFSTGKFIRNRYEIEGGIRYDFQTLDAAGFDKNKEWYGGTHTFNHVSGSIGVFWKAGQTVTFRSNLGLAWRPPSVNELYSNGLHHGSAMIEIGDNSLRTEQGYKWINTLSIEGKAVQLVLDLHEHVLKNYIYLKPSGNFEESLRGAFPVFHYEQTDALFLGIDATISYLISPQFNYEVKGSFLRASDVSRKRYLPMIPSDRIGNTLRWEANSGNHIFGKAFLQVQHDIIFRQTRYENESDFAPPPETYGVMNFRAGTSFLFNGKQAGANFTIDNLLNVSYKEYMNRFRYYAHDLGRNFTLRLFYEF